MEVFWREISKCWREISAATQQSWGWESLRMCITETALRVVGAKKMESLRVAGVRDGLERESVCV